LASLPGKWVIKPTSAFASQPLKGSASNNLVCGLNAIWDAPNIRIYLLTNGMTYQKTYELLRAQVANQKFLPQNIPQGSKLAQSVNSDSTQTGNYFAADHMAMAMEQIGLALGIIEYHENIKCYRIMFPAATPLQGGAPVGYIFARPGHYSAVEFVGVGEYSEVNI